MVGAIMRTVFDEDAHSATRMNLLETRRWEAGVVDLRHATFEVRDIVLDEVS